VITPELLAALDENVDAMIIAHGLGHLERNEAFGILDNPAIAGLSSWQDQEWPERAREHLPAAMDPFMERLPRSTDFFWRRFDAFTDLLLTGIGTESPAAWIFLGQTHFVVEDSSFRHLLSEHIETCPEIDPIPALQCRAFMLRHSIWSPNIGNGCYMFPAGLSLFGIDMESWDYVGVPRHQVERDLNRESGAAARFYETIDVPYGHEWYMTAIVEEQKRLCELTGHRIDSIFR
jgi:hypothetical protein